MESKKGQSEEMHPLFPSGDWEGFYKYPYAGLQQGKMEFFLNFNAGVVTGGGSDSVGTFTWKGTYDTKALTCQMTKYYTSHTVSYNGHVDENGIWGTWQIRTYNKGGFHIWPKKDGNEEEEEEAVEEVKEKEAEILQTLEVVE